MNIKKNKARLLITLKCNRKCKGCCNTYENIMKQIKKISLNDVKNYKEILITGGEPSLIDDLDKIIKILKKQNPEAKIYLYSAYLNFNLLKSLKYIDGLHFTIHEDCSNDDINKLYSLQNFVKTYKNISFRLYIDAKVNRFINIKPNIFSRIEIKSWLTEKELLESNKNNNGLPENEELLLLNEE